MEGGPEPVTNFVMAGRPLRSAPEASAGNRLGNVALSGFPPEEAGGSSPPLPRRKQRLMVPSGAEWPPGHGHPRMTERLQILYENP